MNTLSIENNPQEEAVLKQKAYKGLLWFGIVSIVMLFGGLTSAYIVRQAEGNWLQFELPRAFWLSTAVIILSSVTINWALASAKTNKLPRVKTALLLTLLLGTVFVICQFMAWETLVSQKIFFSGKTSNPSGSFLYVISGLHLAHTLGGLLFLLIAWAKSLKGLYHSGNFLGLQLCATYWHFLDVLWVYLFLFLLFIR